MHAFTRVLYASAIANRKVITTTLVDNRISITPVMKRSSADNSVCAMLVVLTSERSIFSTSAHKSVSTSMNWEHHCAISSVITSYGLNIQYIASDADASVDGGAAFARGENPFNANSLLQIAVCDMNCHAEMSCQCLIDIEPLLAPGAPVVLTLKLVNKYCAVPILVSKVRDVLQGAGFERIQDVWLFANSRFERTLLAWKASEAGQGAK